MNLYYRVATIDDLPAIVEIYNSTVPSRIVTADTEPVTLESKITWFNEHTPEHRPLWIVNDEYKNIVGWVSFQDFYGRPAYNPTAEISIYLKEEFRNKGYGQQILQHCIKEAPALGIKTLLGFIFAHNTPSLNLFLKNGFKEWALLPDVAILDGIERSLIILGLRVG